MTLDEAMRLELVERDYLQTMAATIGMSGPTSHREHERTDDERDALTLWWQSYLWLATEGYLRMTTSLHDPATAMKKGGRFPYLRVAERTMLIDALGTCQWSVSAAARVLGISRRVCRYRIDVYGLVDELRRRNRRSHTMRRRVLPLKVSA